MQRGMRVGVIGTGHVGLVTCVSLASIGHRVVGTDTDARKIARLREGAMPFFEPGVQDLMTSGLESGRLQFSDDHREAVRGADVVFICVGTPPRAWGEASLVAVERAARQVAQGAEGSLVVVEKSTVPAGTAERLRTTLVRERPELDSSLQVVSNPEFLREGQALKDALHPDRILVGADSPAALETMRRLYRPFIEQGTPLVQTDIRTAELAKHACNAFLAMKISYVNALARLCERAGADVEAVTQVMGADPRIGRDFLGAGLGYGGYCLPKDLLAFERLATRLGYRMGLLPEVAKINDEAVEAALEKVREALWNLEDKRIALLGLSFKPETDDIRFSPALVLARLLVEGGATVVGYDPSAGSSAKQEMPSLEVAHNAYEAARGAHCVILCTGWEEFGEIDFTKLAEVVAFRILVDGRNFFDPDAALAAGFTYYSMGRPTVSPGAGGAG
jgi:UDPglucose 6-dehydrogenase